MNPESEHLLSALKIMLRQRRVGYQALADDLGVSLPTVKRMLNKANLPLDRLLKICRIAAIDPAELFALAENQRPRHTQITPEQDELFFEQPAFSTYFMRLMIGGETPDEIAASEGLSQLSTERYLSGLEKVGLLEREGGNRVRIKVSPPLGFGPDSKVLRAKHADFLRRTVEQVLSPGPSDGAFAILKPLCLGRETFAEMIAELKAVVDRFAYISEHPKANRGQEGEHFELSITAAPADGSDEPAAIIELDRE